MSTVAAIREMLANGVPLEDALRYAEAFEERFDERSPAARRQARYRMRQRNESVTKRNAPAEAESVTKRNESVTSVTPLARVEDNPSTKKLSGKEDNNLGAKRHAVTPTPRQILLECLSPESADGVLAHRKAMRRPLTGRAAQLLAKGFAATADPNAAADMMIERGWQGFKPEWFDNERRSNGNGQQQQGQSRRRSLSDVAPGFIKRIDEKFAYLDEVRPSHGGAEGGPTVRMLQPERGKRP